jgi:hypothetical protein
MLLDVLAQSAWAIVCGALFVALLGAISWVVVWGKTGTTYREDVQKYNPYSALFKLLARTLRPALKVAGASFCAFLPLAVLAARF